MNSVSSFSGAAALTAVAACPADPAATAALPGDIAQALFDGMPPFLQLLQGAGAAPEGATDAAAQSLLASLEVSPQESDITPGTVRSAPRRPRGDTDEGLTSGAELLALLASAAVPATPAAPSSTPPTAINIDASAAPATPKPVSEGATASTPVASGSMWSELLDGEADSSPLPQRERESSRFGTPAAPRAAAATDNGFAASFNVINRALAPQVERTVNVPMHAAQWPQAVANEVRWCLDNAVQSATLRITPDHLGPVEIRLEVNDSQVNVNFGAAHADTRAALEAALPRLRDMLAGAGLSLGEASVQQQMRRESQDRPPPAVAALDGEPQSAAPQRLAALGLIDEYV